MTNPALRFAPLVEEREDEDGGDEGDEDGEEAVGDAVAGFSPTLEEGAERWADPGCYEPGEGDGGGDEAPVREGCCVCGKEAERGGQRRALRRASRPLFVLGGGEREGMVGEFTGDDDLLGELEALASESGECARDDKDADVGRARRQHVAEEVEERSESDSFRTSKNVEEL